MELNEKQKGILEQFRELVKDELPDEYDEWYLVRWLRARNFNLKNAEKMFRASMAWRKQYGMDDIESWDPPEVLKKYFQGGHVGYDKEGSPVWVDLAPQLDWRGIVRAAKKSDILKMEASHVEMLTKLLPEQSKKMGKPVSQIVFIMNLEKMGTRHLHKDCVDMFNAMMEVNEGNFPEYAKYIFLIKAPRIFPIIYSLARPFLSEDTKKKVKVLGGNWKEVLLQYVDADQLPAFLGGTLTGPDDDIYCTHLIKQGGEIPHEYYLKGTGNSEGQKTTRATIHHGGTLQLAYDIDMAGIVVKWSFETKHYDLAFGIYLKVTEQPKKLSEMKQVVPTTRVNSHFVPEDGYYTCEQPGTYVFAFDNTYSWLHSKQVEYTVEVLDPYGMMHDPVNKQLQELSLTDTVDEDNNKHVRQEIDSKNDTLVDVPI